MKKEPCPFCLGVALSVAAHDHPKFDYALFSVMCECGASGPTGVDEHAAWATWNNRGAVA